MLKDNIKKYRKAKKMSQEQLATRLYVTRQTVYKWEQGINEPDVDTLKKLCDILDVSIESLIYDNDDKNTNAERDKTAKTAAISNVLFTLHAVIFTFCAVSVFIVLGLLPPQIPAHFNTRGEIDRYGNRAEVLLLLMFFVTMFVVDLVCRLFLRQKSSEQKTATAIVSGVTATFQIAFEVFVMCLYAPFFTQRSLYCLTPFSADTILAVSVGMLPIFCKPNYIIGVRTKFTLSDETAWKKVNLCAFVAFALTSIAIIVAYFTIKTVYSFAFLFAYVAPTVAVAVYHEILRKKSKT